ncbi:MAG: glycogen synthase [Solirubrobacteraceae bacterium]
MRVALLTREYPPEVYGGAGVHVEHLARELRSLVALTVHCWGAGRSETAVVAHSPWEALAGDAPERTALRAVSVDLTMAAAAGGADLVHSHTWYAQLGGHLAKLVHGIPHVATVHSLEPRRPWKAEQLGGGYALSSFCERTALESADAVIAVSHGSRDDILECYPTIDPERVHVVHNGVDTDTYAPGDGARADAEAGELRALGIDPVRPTVLFVGRITRQKGLALLLRAAERFDPSAQLVLCAGSPDTEQLGAEVSAGVRGLQALRDGVVWIDSMIPRRALVAALRQASVFVCPSVYEPLGIVNLEAMACETAVVASDAGGIPEVVVDGETGLLVTLGGRVGDELEPADPQRFADELAARVNELLGDPQRAARMGRAGRRRAVSEFGWPAIAQRTVGIYEQASSSGPRSRLSG